MKIKRFLDCSPAFTIIFASQYIAKQMTIVFKKNNLTYLQAMVLVSIFFEKSNHARPQDLAIFLHTSKSNISHCLAHLQNEKLIQYEQLPSDKRGSVISLTERGQKMVFTLIKYFDDLQNKTEKQFTPEGTKQLIRNIEKLKTIYSPA